MAFVIPYIMMMWILIAGYGGGDEENTKGAPEIAFALIVAGIPFFWIMVCFGSAFVAMVIFSKHLLPEKMKPLYSLSGKALIEKNYTEESHNDDGSVSVRVTTQIIYKVEVEDPGSSSTVVNFYRKCFRDHEIYGSIGSNNTNEVDIRFIANNPSSAIPAGLLGEEPERIDDPPPSPYGYKIALLCICFVGLGLILCSALALRTSQWFWLLPWCATLLAPCVFYHFSWGKKWRWMHGGRLLDTKIVESLDHEFVSLIPTQTLVRTVIDGNNGSQTSLESSPL